jgi:protein SCO1/2
MRARWMKLLALGLLCALAASCAKEQPWRLQNIRGLVPDLAFSMTDDEGRAVSAAEFRGKVVLLYFGYTNCPDVCPTTLATLAQAIRAAGNRGNDVRVLFVTVDPERDSLARMHEYVNAFGPEFVGLRATPEALKELTKRYRVAYSLEAPDAQGRYEVNHSSGVFVFDRDGRGRLLMLPKATVEDLSVDLQRLLQS